jgi:hypothetical protein
LSIKNLQSLFSGLIPVRFCRLFKEVLLAGEINYLRPPDEPDEELRLEPEEEPPLEPEDELLLDPEEELPLDPDEELREGV